MMGYVPPVLSSAAARDVLERSVPSGEPLVVEELVWVPLTRARPDSAGGENVQARADRFSAVGGAGLTTQEVSGWPPEGRVLEPRFGTPACFLPVWSFSTADGRGFGVVDAIDGRIWAVDLPTDRARAIGRLALLVLVAVFSATFGASAILQAIGFAQLAAAVGLGSMSAWAARLAGIAASLWFLVLFAERLERVCEGVLREAIVRVASGRVRGGTGPLPEMLRWSGRLVLAGAIAQGFEWAIGRSLPYAPSLPLVLVTFGLAGAFAWTASRLAKQERGLFAHDVVEEGAGPVHELVRTSLRVFRYCLIAALALYWLHATALLVSLWDGPRLTLPTLAPAVLGAAAIAALARSHLEPRERWLAVLSLSSLLLAKLLFGNTGAFLGPLVVVGLAARVTSRADWRSALAATAGFNAGAALGRLVGSLGGSALLGSLGLVVGENIGELVVGTLALLRSGEPAPATTTRTAPAATRRTGRGDTYRKVLFWAGPVALGAIVVAGLVSPGAKDPDRVAVDARVPDAREADAREPDLTTWVRFQSAPDAVEAFLPGTPTEHNETWVRAIRHLGPDARVEVPVRRFVFEHEGRTWGVLRASVPRNRYMAKPNPLFALTDLLRPSHVQGAGPVFIGFLDDKTDLRAVAHVDGSELWLLYTLSPAGRGDLFDGEGAFLTRSGRLLPDGEVKPLISEAELQRAAEEHFRAYFVRFRRRR